MAQKRYHVPYVTRRLASFIKNHTLSSEPNAHARTWYLSPQSLVVTFTKPTQSPNIDLHWDNLQSVRPAQTLLGIRFSARGLHGYEKILAVSNF